MRERLVENIWSQRWKQKPSFAPVDLKHDTIATLIKEVRAKLNGEKMVFLDVGSGPGSRTIPLLGREEGVRVILLDQSGDALKLAKEYNAKHNGKVNFIQADAFNLPLEDNTVECVFSNGLIEHFANPGQQRLLAEMVRVTKPGGLVAVIVPNKLNPVHTLSKKIAELKGTCNFGPQYDLTPKELNERMQQAGLQDIHGYGAGAFTSWIRIFGREKQNYFYLRPTPSRLVNEVLWKLDGNVESRINQTIGREILAIGKKPAADYRDYEVLSRTGRQGSTLSGDNFPLAHF